MCGRAGRRELRRGPRTCILDEWSELQSGEGVKSRVRDRDEGSQILAFVATDWDADSGIL